MINFQKKVLDNGLRVILAPMSNVDASTLMVLVNVGSRYERKQINGISHFLEHLVFKGTKSRPEPGQIHKDLDRIGAAHNAFTSKETTGFWVKSASRDFDVGLDIIFDILLEPVFKNEEIEKERGVILQEISMYEDEPRRKVLDVLEGALYGDQPVGWDIAGSKESVSSINKEDITKYHDANYLSENMIVVAAGNLEPSATYKKIEKFFGKVKNGKNQDSLKTEIFQKSPNVEIIKKDSDQTHLAMGIRAYDMFNEKRYALNLLSVILGGNFSSRLVMEIREKLGLAYYVYSFGDQYTDCGYLGIGAGIAHNELSGVVKKIIEVIKDIKKNGVTAQELQDAKSFIRGQMAMRLETSDEVASFCSDQEIFYKKIIQPEEIIQKIENVSQDDILKVAAEVFVPETINLAVIGKQEKPKEQELFFKDLFQKSFAN
ncbi:MAG: pitrilysin family protein [bacterium]|nr:pitrilysin family protein [bacterium]